MKIKIDLKIFILVILFYFTKQIELYALLMIFALLHECGHLLAGLILKFKPEKISIMPMGVSISFKVNLEDYNKKIQNSNILSIKKIIIALAGPIVNIIIAVLCTYMNFNMDEIHRLNIVYANLIICVFNLLPIYPLDRRQNIKTNIKNKIWNSNFNKIYTFNSKYSNNMLNHYCKHSNLLFRKHSNIIYNCILMDITNK